MVKRSPIRTPSRPIRSDRKRNVSGAKATLTEGNGARFSTAFE
jgi:hypothetical protein